VCKNKHVFSHSSFCEFILIIITKSIYSHIWSLKHHIIILAYYLHWPLKCSRAKIEIVSCQLKLNSVCACLKCDPELSICAAKNKHRFHIKAVNFILYYSLNNNTASDLIFVHIAWFILGFSVILLFNIVNKCSCRK
jgi:hypothetical protein